MIKKITISLLSLISCVFILPCMTYAQNGVQNGYWATNWVEWIRVPWTIENQEDSLIHTIRTAINWVLGMLALVSLVLCLYAGFKMLTSWWDSKKYDAWLSIIKNAAIWLAIIALSWLIVSLIFWIINGSVAPNISDNPDPGIVE